MTATPTSRRPSLIASTPSLNDALGGLAPVVTATERQAREIRYHDQGTLEGSVACFSQAEFWETLFRQGQDDGYIDRAVLSSEGLRVLTRDAASRPSWREHLDTFLDAWNLAHAAGISFVDDRFRANEATRVFASWARALTDQLAQRRFASHAELPGLVLQSTQRLPDFVSFGFRPSQAANLPRFAAQGIDLIAPGAADCHYTAFAERDDELRSAAQWARGMLDHAETIAVVVDELGATTGQVIQRFQAAFADVELEKYVSFSGGVSLGQERVVSHALGVLKMMIEGVDDDLRRSLLISPFVFPDAELRQIAARHLTFMPLARFAPVGLQFFGENPPRDDVADQIRRGLGLWGWPGRGLDSREYQAVAQFERLIDNVARALRLASRFSWRDVLMTLIDQAKRAVFSPQAHHAPIQVLGRDESYGLSFDAVWVTGCQRGNWPKAPLRNPFLPMDFYTEALVPGGTFASAQASAHELQTWWQASTGVLVQSLVVEDGDVDDVASIVTSRAALIPKESQLGDVIASGTGHPHARAGRGIDVAFEDESPPGLSTESGSATGGTALLTDQSLCAFRGWAIHRLNLRARYNQTVLPTKAELGSVLHELLANATTALPSPAAIEAADDAFLARVVDAVVDAQTWPKEFRRVERARLNGLLRAWRDLELKRGDFEVIAIEEDREIDVGSIRIQARLDRVDRVDGQTVVIDYKSGRSSINDWLPPRPRAPQVPLYVVNEGADAAAYLQLDDGVRLSGVGDPRLETRGIRSADRFGFASMQALDRAWRDEIEHLTDELAAGYNVPMPSSRSCAQCHLAPVCREFSRG